MYSVLLDMVSRSLQADPHVSLRPGAVLHGTVEGAPGRLTVTAGPLRAALPESAQFQPRQAVVVEVKETPQGLQLLVRAAATAPGPEAVAPAAAAGVTAEASAPETTSQTPTGAEPGAAGKPAVTAKPDMAALIRMVTRALEAAGSTSQANMAVEMLPAALPHSESIMSEFFAAYTNKAALGDDLRALGHLATRASLAGALPPREAGLLTNAIARSLAKGLSEFEAVLGQLAHDAAPLEAKIAEALASSEPRALDDALKQDLRWLLGKLRHDETFRGFLRENGQLKTFDQLADRVLARMSEGSVQNIRSLDQPYLFVQIPFAPGAPIQRAQIHVLSGGKGQGREFDAHNATIALDLTTERLGDLWITVTVDGMRCACRICARSEGAAETLRGAAGELEASLRASGYRHATVETSLWDGDRLRAAAMLMRRYSGLDVEV